MSETGSNASDGSSDSDTVPTFPDPLPPPVNAILARSTRSVANNENSVVIVNSAQMVPVIVGLIDAVMESAFVRSEIDEGTKMGKEAKREAKECAKIEEERWDAEKKVSDEAQGKDKEVNTNTCGL